jgi:hypothetical protein
MEEERYVISFFFVDSSTVDNDDSWKHTHINIYIYTDIYIKREKGEYASDIRHPAHTAVSLR